MIDQYPEIAKYASVDSNGMLTISEEGYEVLKGELIDRSQEAQNLQYLSQASEAYANIAAIEDKYKKGSEYSYGTTEISAEDQATIASYEAQAQEFGRLFVTQAGNAMLAQVYDTSQFKIDTDELLHLSSTKLKSEFRNTLGYEADESLSKEQMAQMVASKQIEEEQQATIDNLAPVFQQIGELDPAKVQALGNSFKYTDQQLKD